MIKVTMTTYETEPTTLIAQSGATITAQGVVDGYDWARYNRNGASCLAVWRTVAIPPDGYDYQMVTGTMDALGRMMDRKPLGDWARNMGEWDIVQRARYGAMTSTERDTELAELEA